MYAVSACWLRWFAMYSYGRTFYCRCRVVTMVTRHSEMNAIPIFFGLDK